MRSLVFLAAWMPAMRGDASTSPSWRCRPSISAASPATFRCGRWPRRCGWVAALAPTSTMWAWPWASKWVRGWWRWLLGFGCHGRGKPGTGSNHVRNNSRVGASYGEVRRSWRCRHQWRQGTMVPILGKKGVWRSPVKRWQLLFDSDSRRQPLPAGHRGLPDPRDGSDLTSSRSGGWGIASFAACTATRTVPSMTR